MTRTGPSSAAKRYNKERNYCQNGLSWCSSNIIAKPLTEGREKEEIRAKRSSTHINAQVAAFKPVSNIVKDKQAASSADSTRNQNQTKTAEI